MLANLADNVQIFTDGSMDPRCQRSAFGVSVSWGRRFPDGICVFTAELVAILCMY